MAAVIKRTPFEGGRNPSNAPCLRVMNIRYITDDLDVISVLLIRTHSLTCKWIYD